MSSSAENQVGSSFEEKVIATVRACDFFARNSPIWVARAPGRLDVMGGNVDYTGGLVLQALLREAVWAAVQPREENRVRICNPGAVQFGWEPYLEFQTTDLEAETIRSHCERTQGMRWAAYVLGGLHFLQRFHRPNHASGGMDIFITSNLPPNKGVSSSAALEVAVLKASSAAWGIRLDGVALATAGQWVENVVAGAACGIMDQAAIVLGEEDRLLALLCQPCQPFSRVKLPAGVRIWGIDSMVPRATSGTSYDVARAAAFMAYKLICQAAEIEVVPEEAAQIPRWTDPKWHGYLSNLAPSEFRSGYERLLPESLRGAEFLPLAGEHVDSFTRIDPEREYPVRAAGRYAVEENYRVQTLAALLESAAWDRSENTLRLAGEILCQSHFAYSECGLGSPACDELVTRALQAGLPGAKMTGGGAGGVVAVLGCAEDRPVVEAIAREYGATRGETPYIFEGSSPGVDTFGVRTIEPSLATVAQ